MSADYEERIPVQPLREILLRRYSEGETWSSMARRLGWTNPVPRNKNWTKSDSTRLKRLIGIVQYESHGQYKIRETIKYDTALRVCEALDIDPIYVGL